MLRHLIWIAALFLLPLPARAGVVVTAELRGAVSPASAAYFERVLGEARNRQAALVVVTLDTPGGLDTAMRRMIQGILASPVPVAMFVYPSGARAASAGTFLLYASHVAAMAPGTTLGAATPVSIGGGGGDRGAGDGKSDGKGAKAPGSAMEAKAIQDAAAYARGLAQLRGRNAQWAEQAVREAASLSAEEALKARAVDVLANDVPDLLNRVDGRPVKMAGGQMRPLDLADATLVKVEPNWKEGLLAGIADPNIALILLMVGVYGLLFEFYTPGTGVPGILGGICLLLAFYGLALLPISWVGASLVLLGIGFMVAEAFMPSFGVLGIGGIAAFIAGALMLVDSDIPGLAVSWALVVPLAIASGIAVAAIGVLALRARNRPPASGRELMIGAPVQALENIDHEGWVRAFGERWRARSSAPLPEGGEARIVAIDGLTLVVEPAAKGERQ
ncbi:MAG: nodulation protein NfeD [Rhodocyclaceae bacterium]|nr:nodulation protein NfeD [Rhodocyclaceae bacterium]